MERILLAFAPVVLFVLIIKFIGPLILRRRIAENKRRRRASVT